MEIKRQFQVFIINKRMTTSGLTRQILLETALKNKGYLTDRVQISVNEDGGNYTEILREDECAFIGETKLEYKALPPMMVVRKLVNERIASMLEMKGYEIAEDVDYESTDFYDGYEINVPFVKKKKQFDENTFFNEIDKLFEREPVKVKANPASAPLNQEPNHVQTNHIPTAAKRNKTQNPKKVDLVLKSVFESRFMDYLLATDVGNWKPIKSLKENGKLLLTWENQNINSIQVTTLLFPEDTNKIKIQVLSSHEVVIDYFFEIYRIPTDAFLAEKFFRKTFFNLLKKFIDTRVIQIEPFALDFIFWKTDNPFFSYSFSSPKKNKIVKDLIAFISIAKKPILDDFFEQNNLKHKQGYLQTLLDSAEAAGIFKFAREGNEIVILKGPNYKAFLDGKIRRVAS